MIKFKHGVDIDPAKRIENVLERIKEKGAVVAPEYKDYIECLHAIATEFGEGGREYAHEAFQFYPDYKREELDKVYSSVLIGNKMEVNIGTFYFHCQQAGVDISVSAEEVRVEKPKRGRPKKVKEENVNLAVVVKEYLTRKYEFRFNELTESIELRYKEHDGKIVGKWYRMNDRIFKTIYTGLMESDIKVKQNDVDAIIYSKDFSPNFNPIMYYLKSLPEWDQQTDYIEQFFDYFDFETPEIRSFCMPLLKKWFCCMVALWLKKVDDNQIMPVFIGPSRIGKTYFCKNVLPKTLKEFYHTVYPGERFDKDQLIAMSEYAVVAFDEFKLSCKTTNQMKAIVSMSSSEQRKAYGRFAEKRSRLCSLIASCNDKQYMARDDGSRRYLSVSVVGSKNINENPMPYEGAYAQALWIVDNMSADTYRPSYQEAREIESFNNDYVVPDICETLLSKYYRAPREDEQGVYVLMADIIEKLSYMKSSAINEVNIGKALKKMGIKGSRNARGKRYLVVKINLEQEMQIDLNDAKADFEARQKKKENITETSVEDVILPF